MVEQPERQTPVQSIEIAVLQMVVTWGVQRAMTSGYRTLTGREEPTARDAAVPLRRIVAWAAASAAAVAVSNVAVDRLVLRRDQHHGETASWPQPRRARDVSGPVAE